MTKKGEKKGKKLEITKEYLEQELYLNKKSPAQIAEELGTYTNKIRRTMLSLGLPTRNKSEAQKQALEQNRSKHPTKGIVMSGKIKAKVSATQHKRWAQMSEEEKAKRSDIHREIWNKKTPEELADMRKKANIGLRKSAEFGSRNERALAGFLVSKGFAVQVHRKHSLANENLEVDIYLPQLRIAIEIDGVGHYEPIFGDEVLARTKKSDDEKNALLLTTKHVVIRVKHVGEHSMYYTNALNEAVLKEVEKVEKKRAKGIKPTAKLVHIDMEQVLAAKLEKMTQDEKDS